MPIAHIWKWRMKCRKLVGVEYCYSLEIPNPNCSIFLCNFHLLAANSCLLLTLIIAESRGNESVTIFLIKTNRQASLRCFFVSWLCARVNQFCLLLFIFLSRIIENANSISVSNSSIWHIYKQQAKECWHLIFRSSVWHVLWRIDPKWHWTFCHRTRWMVARQWLSQKTTKKQQKIGIETVNSN